MHFSRRNLSTSAICYHALPSILYVACSVQPFVVSPVFGNEYRPRLVVADCFTRQVLLPHVKFITWRTRTQSSQYATAFVENFIHLSSPLTFRGGRELPRPFWVMTSPTLIG